MRLAPLLGVFLASALLLACGKGRAPDSPAPAASAAAASKPAATLLLSPEDLRTLSTGQQATGPVVTGSLQPERRADLRAELGALVKQVLKENGEPVRTGDLLVRLTMPPSATASRRPRRRYARRPRRSSRPSARCSA